MRTRVLLAFVGVAQAQAQQSLWGQCGGNNWSGPTTCVSGAYCHVQNAWYHQCIPGSNPSPTTTTQAPPPPPPTTTTTFTTSRLTTSSTSQPTTTTSPGNGGGSPATCPSTPSSLSVSVSNLNDPFTFADGTTKVTSSALWTCRQSEISELFQRYELGTLPPKPSVSASFSGSTLSITASTGGKSISFSVTIRNIPSGSGPHPAIIAYGAASIPVPNGVATIIFNNDEIAAQQSASASRGRGKFFDLYGSSHSAGALTAWAWGVGRVIDALELTQASTNIDPTRIGVTGCSRNGKGAFVAGALEPRIALTLPQESGSGGSACWRISDWQKNRNNQNVQTAQQIITENVWFSTNFNSHVNNVNGLPLDHHFLAGLVAPRPLYVMENSDMEWLGRLSTYGCMGGGRKIYQALGALDKFGYSQVGGNSHCSFPSAKQGGELTAFIGKYLLKNNNAGTTSIFRTEQNLGSFSLDSWCPWSVPTLS
ncbi:hypothetical protein V8F20_010357 [Naviculisporaceae sp. PSN 640]